MKKLLIVVLLISLALGVGNLAWAGARGTGKAGDIMGQGKLDSEPQRTFRLVRFHQGAGDVPGNLYRGCEISADSVVCWNLTDDDGVTVMLMQGRSLPSVAGILATTCDSESMENVDSTLAQDIGSERWAYMQTYGLCNFRIDGAADVTEGEALGTGDIYGTVGRFIATTTAGATTNATGSANGQLGFAYDAGEALDTIQGFIRTE